VTIFALPEAGVNQGLMSLGIGRKSPLNILRGRATIVGSKAGGITAKQINRTGDAQGLN